MNVEYVKILHCSSGSELRNDRLPLGGEGEQLHPQEQFGANLLSASYELLLSAPVPPKLSASGPSCGSSYWWRVSTGLISRLTNARFVPLQSGKKSDPQRVWVNLFCPLLPKQNPFVSRSTVVVCDCTILCVRYTWCPVDKCTYLMWFVDEYPLSLSLSTSLPSASQSSITSTWRGSDFSPGSPVVSLSCDLRRRRYHRRETTISVRQTCNYSKWLRFLLQSGGIFRVRPFLAPCLVGLIVFVFSPAGWLRRPTVSALNFTSLRGVICCLHKSTACNWRSRELAVSQQTPPAV